MKKYVIKLQVIIAEKYEEILRLLYCFHFIVNLWTFLSHPSNRYCEISWQELNITFVIMFILTTQPNITVFNITEIIIILLGKL